MAITKKRLALLQQLEHIIGNEIYNPKIQNRGSGGVLESEGRRYRYPLTFQNDSGELLKGAVFYGHLPTNVQMTGYYAFGSNHLHILHALDKVVTYLQEHNSLQV
jgi:hypothetical protein